MSAQWAQFLRVTFTLLMLTCAQSAALVLMFAQAAQFLKDKLLTLQIKSPAHAGDFSLYMLLSTSLDLPHISEINA
jgi:hypothetical protein